MIAVIALSLLAGGVLGILGGGGSILMIPILSYAGGLPAKAAIAAPLVVVGISSAIAAIPHVRRRRVDWRTAISFGLAGMLGAVLGGRAAAALDAGLLMLAFAAIVLASAIAMLRPRGGAEPAAGRLATDLAILAGIGFGFVTGLVGAGGGFLVVPALIVLGGVAPHVAIATSLVVIAMNAAAALVTHLGHTALDWPLTLAAAAACVVGSLLGGAVGSRIPPALLRRAFGTLLAVMGMVILVVELRGCA